MSTNRADAPASGIMGTVKWFNAEKNFGFISPVDEGDDIFFHKDDVVKNVYGSHTVALNPGEKVKFDIIDSAKGHKAVKVRNPLMEMEKQFGCGIKGIVKTFDLKKRFGFITAENYGDIFFHESGSSSGKYELVVGQEVEFDVIEGGKGPQAVNVKKLTQPQQN